MKDKIAEQMFGTKYSSRYPDLNKKYPEDLIVDESYVSSLPDLQNGETSLIKGSSTEIQHVGVSNFILPIKYLTKGGDPIKLETSVTGTVSLEGDKKGINMSRIMRTFYNHSKNTFSLDVIDEVLSDYKQKLNSHHARILMKFRYPMIIKSLRSGLEGYQYYNVAVEVVKDKQDNVKKIIHLDYVYSSTCPCSLELSEHARKYRNQMATPHSQRSIARISVVVKPGSFVYFEDLIESVRRAIPTETQVMVKREDEQAFAEKNGANSMFVEDAVRLIHQELLNNSSIGDFRVVATHMESLHSHDAISVLIRGDTFNQESYDPHAFASLAWPHIG